MHRNAFLKLNFSLFTTTPAIRPNAKLMMQISVTDIRRFSMGLKYASMAAMLTAMKDFDVCMIVCFLVKDRVVSPVLLIND